MLFIFFWKVMSWIWLSIGYFNVTKLYLEKQAVSQYLKNFHGIVNKNYKFLLTSCSKRLCMHNWDTILESHRRLDKTVYSESSVQVSH